MTDATSRTGSLADSGLSVAHFDRSRDRTPLHTGGTKSSLMAEIVEYSPSLVKWQVTVGIWAFGLMIYTVALQIAIYGITGESNLHKKAGER